MHPNLEMCYFFLVVNRYYNRKYESDRLAREEEKRRISDVHAQRRSQDHRELDSLLESQHGKDEDYDVIQSREKMRTETDQNRDEKGFDTEALELNNKKKNVGDIYLFMCVG